MPKTDYALLLDLYPSSSSNTSKMFYKLYSKILTHKLTNNKPIICPNVQYLLGKLKDIGVSMGIFTGNAQQPAKAKLSSVDLLKYFDFGLFGDFEIDKKTIILNYIRNFPQNRKLLIIGDSEADILAAKIANLPIIAVATGWTSYETLNSLKPNAIVRTIPENYDIFFKIIETLC